VVISSKAIAKFPLKQDYVVGYMKPVKSLLFFVTETPSYKYNFNTANPLGFSNVTLTNGNATTRINFLLAANPEVKTLLINSIINFVTTPEIIIKVKLRNNYNWKEDVEFFASIGFANPRKSPSEDDLEMDLMPPGYQVDIPATMQEVTAVSRNLMFLCRLKIYFPESLAELLSRGVKDEPYEIGGRVFIETYTKDFQGNNVAIIGTKPEYMEKGDENNISLSNISPISFHTHPEKSVRDYAYVNWPSNTDMVGIVGSYLIDSDVLVHFVASFEGIWVVHLRPAFQTFLRTLKTTNNETESSKNYCQRSLKKYITDTFELFDYVKSSTVPSELRGMVKDKFISLSKNLRISNFLDSDPLIKTTCGLFASENFYLFDVELIKWETFFKNKVVMSFSYVSTPQLPCKLPVDAPYVQTTPIPAIDFSENSEEESAMESSDEES
jgi:hypothetical protein